MSCWAVSMTEPEERTVRSFCRICTAVCGILVDVSGDEVVRVRGDQDHPFSHGYTCPKGRALPRMHHHPERLERPLMRIGDQLQPTTWDVCLDDLATRLRAVVDTHGPEAIGVFFGSGVGMDAAGYRTAEALYASARHSGSVQSPHHRRHREGDRVPSGGRLPGAQPPCRRRPRDDGRLRGLQPGRVPRPHVRDADPVTAIRALRAQADVWVVDPRRTETARLATDHLAPRPGTDFAVLAMLVREILRDGADRDVLERRTVGSDALAAAVAPFTVEHTSRIADVSEADLTRLLDAVRRAGRVAVVTGTGVTMSASANVTQWLAWALMIVTDSMNRPGGVWFHPGFAHQLEAFELPDLAARAACSAPARGAARRARSFLGEWPCAVLGDEIRAGNIRAVLNLGGHLVTAFPDANDLVPALRSLDVFATIEIIGNDTTALSTHVLPTKDQLERADVTLWDALLPRVAAQHTPAGGRPGG